MQNDIGTVDIILIVDFGSQFTQLIARRVREIEVYAEIVSCKHVDVFIAKYRAKIKGVILSGGPDSTNDQHAPEISDSIFALNVPILAICYGQQALCKKFGGEVESAAKKEFGKASLQIVKESELFSDFWNVGDSYQVWMSHGDHISRISDDCVVVGVSENAPFAFIEHPEKKIYGVQFHPEVVHTLNGHQLIKNFVLKIAGCKQDWRMDSFLRDIVDDVQRTVKQDKVVCGISGGVDSSVVAALTHKAIGENLYCIFVDNGLLRKNEADEVEHKLRQAFSFRLIRVDASDEFLNALKGVVDPEAKRKIIGRVFIEVFFREIQKIGGVKYLAQGTIYPDVIESLAVSGDKQTTIKSHHNVGGLPENMYGLKLLEPLRLLFKDEVRLLANELHIPSAIVKQHPFPGPGLAIRVIGEVTKAKCDLLRAVDQIFIDELRSHDLYDEVWQAYAALLPMQSVGVMGDARTYHSACSLRAVTSIDGMTAEYAELPHAFLSHVARRIVNEVEGISRVFYDITSKPPATIELE